MIIYDTNRLRNAVGFTLTLKAWGNRRKADISQVQTDADKRLMRLSKELIEAKEYEDIKSFFGELRQWVYSRTVPSFFKEGFQLASPQAVEEIEARMKKAQSELGDLVNKLCEVYPLSIDKAQIALGTQFQQKDYPPVEELRRMFSVTWNYISFTVPENIPAELREIEKQKLEKQMQDAGDQITQALRVGFQELIAHAIERLQPGDDGKSKTFRDSLIGNVQEFINTFSSRNLLGDNELENLVSKAQEILIGVSPTDLRKKAEVREETLKQFAEIKAALDPMIETRPNRRFALE